MVFSNKYRFALPNPDSCLDLSHLEERTPALLAEGAARRRPLILSPYLTRCFSTFRSSTSLWAQVDPIGQIGSKSLLSCCLRICIDNSSCTPRLVCNNPSFNVVADGHTSRRTLVTSERPYLDRQQGQEIPATGLSRVVDTVSARLASHPESCMRRQVSHRDRPPSIRPRRRTYIDRAS